MIKAVVGSGGKTTLIRNWAKAYVETGRKVFVTTSTHMMIEEDTLLTEDADEIIGELEEKHYVMAGVQEKEKIRALPLEVYEKVCSHADIVLIEADGSRHMPIKYPASHEPVIYDNVDEIVIVTGLQALNHKASEVSWRIELVKQCLGIEDDTKISPVHIQTLLQKGYVKPLREKYPEKKISIHPAHDQTLYQRALAALMKAEMDVSLIEEAWFAPEPHLFICGGGHISCDLVKIASCLDFHITVMDDREEFAEKERFPQADRVICDSFENLGQYLEPWSYVVVVTRGHAADYECVRTILSHPYAYLGMIGSKKKVQKTFESLITEGFHEEQIRTIHAPIGLKIGAVTPAEISVSILAEIIAEKNGKQTASASKELLEVQEHGVLCIIIEKTGSSPRGVGSMMFVGEESVIGSVGGGAVEFAVIREARNHPKAQIKEYQLNQKESAELGMICGGSNRILFLPI
ncbi:MAG: selenium cofactor biosynthesis protein YqeC [Fusicatenibacter sp.]|nr:selenium cofactor biosynthesis protein YqeC [Lachnospiraceae bacterium]MDY2937712.1 selenium cofactor biosynthesis protein YqeC [Fusicatenibacter sp.]